MTGDACARTNAPVAQPLAGLRVLVTRAREQSAALVEWLRALGADPVELPVISIEPAPLGPLDDALARLGAYDWVVFTSVNGVRAFFDRLAATRSAAAPVSARIGAIGPATAAAVRERGYAVAFTPPRFVAEAAVEGLVELGVSGRRILLPRADIARDVLPEGLRAAGAEVDVVVAYRTRPAAAGDDRVLAALRGGEVDVLTFASPSTVRNLALLLGAWRPSAAVACIGPITAQAARDAGFAVDIEADEYSIPGLVEALSRWNAAQATAVDGEERTHA